MWGRSRRGERGFTLIEMMAVVLVITILAGIALPRFKVAIVRAREAALKEDLFRLREQINQYHADKGRYPASLQALVEDGYVRSIEADPITGGADWVEVPFEGDPDNPGTDETGIVDVHSASELTGLDGKPYAEW
jgi:general secretion pathway protein G